MTDAGLSLGQTLTDSILHSLYNQLGIASYLMDKPCQLGKFTPSKDGWKRGLYFSRCIECFEGVLISIEYFESVPFCIEYFESVAFCIEYFFK